MTAGGYQPVSNVAAMTPASTPRKTQTLLRWCPGVGTSAAGRVRGLAW
jgi:hypothetical protein